MSPQEGYGIGDDENSVAFDGCRQLLWFDAASQPADAVRWQPGDVVGALLDLVRREVIFSHNGRPMKPFTEIFKCARGKRRGAEPSQGFFAAASFMSFQQCRFNFGSRPFRHAPPAGGGGGAQSFNAHGSLTDEEKKILPR